MRSSGTPGAASGKDDTVTADAASTAPSGARPPDRDPAGTAGVATDGISPEAGGSRSLRLLPGGGRGLAVQAALPLEWSLPSGLPAEPPDPPRLRLVQQPPTEAPPHPGPWAARLAPAIIEVLAGERPPAQLARWVTRELRREFILRHDAARRHPAGRGRPAPLRRTSAVRLCPVADGIVEAAAVVVGAERARAVALRLEATGEPGSPARWLVTQYRVG